MKLKKIFTYVIIFMMLAVGARLAYLHFFKPPAPKLYKAEPPLKRSISQVVSASGILEIKDLMKIGSIVSGTIRELYIKENQFVKKGELLAEIDPGTGETDFEKAYWTFMKSEKEYIYISANFGRQEKLFKAGQVSKDSFEKISTDFATKELEVKINKAALAKERLNLNNRKILAVGDGFVTAVNVYKGSGVTGVEFSNYSLFEIAPDITEMEIKLDIDESDIGYVKPAQSVALSINTYPDMILKAKIRSVGFSPKPTKDNGSTFYKAIVDINNKEKLFRPGMTLNAKINVAKSKKALCISGLAFQIHHKSLEGIAKKLSYTIHQLDKKAKKAAKLAHAKERIKFVWIAQGASFIEKAVVIGITDESYFEIKSGLAESDLVITDIVEADEMEKMYKKWFQGPL